jgi:hypothetical protein
MEVVAVAPQGGRFDRQASIMSLPFIFKTELDTIPAEIPYITAEPPLVEKWRERFGDSGFKIGICWQGNPRYRGDASRSVPLRQFEAIARIPGVRLISLQAINGVDQLKDLPDGMTVETLGDDIVGPESGFAETAAAMANLDLMVTSDTALAHLAGAMGLPTFVALSARPDWRWLRRRSDSPWYPTMRLFRQAKPGEWAAVFAEMAAVVAERAAA